MTNPTRSNSHPEGKRQEHNPRGISSPTNSINHRWRDRLIRYVLAIAWIANAVLLVGAFLWIFCDGWSLPSMELLGKEIDSYEFTPPLVQQDHARLPRAVSVVKVGVLLAVATLIAMLCGLLFGPRGFRGLRPWLLFVTLICAWLGLLTTWPELYWYGQQVRLRRHIHAYNDLAQTLQANWPGGDSEMPEIGAFLAYPISAPTTLLLLEETTIPDSPVHMSAIERPAKEVMSIELSGAEKGAWLVWRSDDTPPGSYVGGLGTANQVMRYARIAPNWYLVRYQTSAAPGAS